MFPRRFWDLHRQYLSDLDRASFYLAYLGDMPLACLGAGWEEIWVTELLSGTSDAAREGSHFSGEALKLKIVRDAIARGVRYYDMAGVRVDKPTNKEEAILRYKRKFGGVLTRIPLIDMHLSGPRG